MNPLLAPLIGTWLLFATDPVILPADQIDQHQVYVRIEEGAIFGWTGCNGFNADLIEREGRIRPHKMVATAAVCRDERGEIERALLSAVFALDRAMVEGGKLILGQDATLTFRKTTEQTSRSDPNPPPDIWFAGGKIKSFK